MNPRQPMFAFLTHFHLMDNLWVTAESTVRLSSFLSQLPVLTHFAVFWDPSVGGDFPTAREILTACKALRVFVLSTVQWGTKVESLPSLDDFRFVHMNLGVRHVQGYDGWLAQTRGGIDLWARADAFVEKKWRGEIQPGLFVLTVLRYSKSLNSLISFSVLDRPCGRHSRV
jgi:hypothetical protein